MRIGNIKGGLATLGPDIGAFETLTGLLGPVVRSRPMDCCRLAILSAAHRTPIFQASLLAAKGIPNGMHTGVKQSMLLFVRLIQHGLLAMANPRRIQREAPAG